MLLAAAAAALAALLCAALAAAAALAVHEEIRVAGATPSPVFSTTAQGCYGPAVPNQTTLPCCSAPEDCSASRS